MLNQTVEQLKQEVAGKYVEKYKQELGRLKSLALYPIEKEVKNILSGNVNLSENFNEIKEFGWRGKLLKFISKDMASDLLTFMKEKRLEIEKRKTESELIDLKNEVLGVKKTNSITSSKEKEKNESEQKKEDEVQQDQTSEWQRSAKYWVIATSSIAGAGIIDNIRKSKSAKKAAREIGKENMQEVAILTRNNLDKLNEQAKQGLNEAKNNPRLTAKQKRNIDKAIQKFDQQMGKIGDDAIDVYNAYMKLGERMPRKVLQGIEMLNPKDAKKIMNIADQLVGKTADEMKVLLNSHKITGVSDDVIASLVKMWDKTDDFLAMTKVLSAPAKAKNIFHLMKSAFIIDIACLGFDIWMFTETLNEADFIAKVNEIRAQNKKNQAWTQLAIGVASLAVELWILIVATSIGSTAWPIGTMVGLAVGAISMAVSMGVDALYFDVQDFYKQNKEDYIRQSRSELKQAILQHLHNKKEGNISFNEKIWSPDRTQKDMTLKDAWESIFFLEMIDNEKSQSEFYLLLEYKLSGQSEQEFLGSRDSETHKLFEEQKEKLNESVALKMEYIKKSLGEEKIVTWLKSSQGMHYLSQLIAESSFYAERKAAGKWEEKSLKENVEQAKNEVLGKIPNDLKYRLDDLYKKDKHFLYELYYGAVSYAPAIQGEEEIESDTEKQRNQKLRNNIQHIENYIKALEIANTWEEQYRTNFTYGNLNYNYITAILEHDFEMKGFEFQNFSTNAVKSIAYYNRERNVNIPVSDSVSQNIIYRLAVEFYGYTGNNDSMELMKCFSEGTWSVHWLYYKDGWYINNDWEIDQKFNLMYLDDKTLSDKDISSYVDRIIKNILYTPNIVNWQVVGYSRKSMIDTPTESIDTYLNNEFETRFKKILQEELSFRTVEKQQDIKEQISTFIKDFSNDGGYVELPYYLVIAARRAGLGDLEKTQFSFKDNKIVAVGQVHDLRAIWNIPVEKDFVEQARDTFTPEEMQYINLVESIHKQLESLRSIEGWGSREDDLDIPVEIEHDISQHYKDWNTLKGRLLCYDPKISQSLLQQEYITYYTYFDSLYRGILLSLNSFNWTNDIDTMSYFQQVLFNWGKELFDENGVLKKNKENELEIEWKGIEEFYNKQLNTQIYNNKTIKELWSSGDEWEKKMAQWYSNHIIVAMLESYLLDWDDKGNLEGFRHSWNGTTKGEMSLSLDDKEFLQKFSSHLDSRILKYPFSLDGLKLPDIYRTKENIHIRSYTQRDKNSESLSKVIQKKIEQTLPNVERQGKRWDMKYYPEDSTLESRWQKIKIDFIGENKIKVPWFSRALDIQSWLWLLNFINRYTFTYSWKKKSVTHEYEWSRSWYRKGLVRDGTVLILDRDLKKYIEKLTSDEIPQIAEILNR